MKNIAQQFSNASKQYNTLTDIQLNIACQLAENFSQCCAYETVLDIGTGTGRIVDFLNKRLSSSMIIGIDIAEGMLEEARLLKNKAYWIEADAHRLPFKDNIFDGIISGSTYQWVENLPQAFCEVQRCLIPDGIFMMAMFGEKTFEEMFVVLSEATDDVRSIYTRLPMVREIHMALDQSGLRDVGVHVENKIVRFDDLWTLLRWIKNIGANGLNPSMVMGKNFLNRANEIYQSLFPLDGGIQVSFEIVWVDAKK